MICETGTWHSKPNLYLYLLMSDKIIEHWHSISISAKKHLLAEPSAIWVLTDLTPSSWLIYCSGIEWNKMWEQREKFEVMWWKPVLPGRSLCYMWCPDQSNMLVSVMCDVETSNHLFKDIFEEQYAPSCVFYHLGMFFCAWACVRHFTLYLVYVFVNRLTSWPFYEFQLHAC